MSVKKKFKVVPCYDKVLIRQLHQKIFPTDEWCDDDSIDWVVMNADGKPVGFCMLTQHDKETSHMARAGVLDAYQGFGLHRRMIMVRERFARRMKFTSVTTYTKIDNIKSSSNLQKMGYKIYLPAKPYADKDCIYWRKDL